MKKTKNFFSNTILGSGLGCLVILVAVIGIIAVVGGGVTHLSELHQVTWEDEKGRYFKYNQGKEAGALAASEALATVTEDAIESGDYSGREMGRAIADEIIYDGISREEFLKDYEEYYAPVSTWCEHLYDSLQFDIPDAYDKIDMNDLADGEYANVEYSEDYYEWEELCNQYLPYGTYSNVFTKSNKFKSAKRHKEFELFQYAYFNEAGQILLKAYVSAYREAFCVAYKDAIEAAWSEYTNG
jgi:hypothetical protein